MAKKKGSWLLAAGMIAAAAGYHVSLRPRLLHWGAMPDERRRSYPGDELVPRPRYQTTRAITVGAPPGQVWPWLIQIGYGRAGFYSYDWLENLAGLDVESADRVVPEWQELSAGDAVHIAPETPMTVARVEPPRALVLHTAMHPFTAQPVDHAAAAAGPFMDWSWAFVLAALPGDLSRLAVRVRADYRPDWLAPLVYAVLEPAHFLMERRMLLGLKARVEGNGQD